MIDCRLSQNEANVCLQPFRVLCPDARAMRVNVLVSLLVTSILFMSVSVSAAPRISAGHSSNLRLSNIGGTVGYSSNSGSQITQMVFGPGPDMENDLPPVTVPVVKLLFAAPLGQPLHFVEA